MTQLNRRDLEQSLLAISREHWNLGGDIRPVPRFTVDRRRASKQLDLPASSAQSEASGCVFLLGFEAGSPIPGVNAEYVTIQGQLQE